MDFFSDLGDLSSLLDLPEDGGSDQMSVPGGNRILLIGKKESFIINAIKNNLESHGYEVIDVSFKADEVSQNCARARLIILYADGDMNTYLDTLECVRENVVPGTRDLIVIGGKNEFDTVDRFIPEHHLAGRIPRPLNVNTLLDMVGEVLTVHVGGEEMRTVLVIDDDLNYLHMIREWLRENYHVGMATSGMQAITWLATNHADLILLDYEMPITTGSQVLEMLRSEPASRNIPVMFLTGHDDKESILKVLAMRPAGYLLKTIDREGLLKTIEDFFKGKSI